jgi:hypothetical protein
MGGHGRRDTSERDNAGKRRSRRERQVRSETEIEGKLQPVEQCIWREMPLLQYCKVNQRENNVQEARQERGKARKRHGIKMRREGDKS